MKAVERRLRILHVGPVCSAQHQGLFHAIRGLVRAQHQCGADVTLLTTHPRDRYPEKEVFPVIYFRDTTLKRIFSFEGPAAAAGRFDLVVIHSTYIPFHARVARFADSLNVPYVLVAHGGMSRRALSVKKWKKRLGNFVFFGRMVKQAAALHFLTEAEAHESGGWKKPYFVVGNGIDLPEIDSGRFQQRGADLPLQLLFLGRLDWHIKGLDLLVEALGLVKAKRGSDSFRLTLCGPDVSGSSRQISEWIRRFDLEGVVDFAGPVYGEEKVARLQHADLFVLTSRSEGHPVAVLEALSYGIPCLVTPETRIADVIVHAGAGWRVEGRPDAIAAGIEQIVRERNRLSEVAEKARKASELFNWSRIAQETLSHYQQIIVASSERSVWSKS